MSSGYVLRLYVAGNAPNSMKARSNLEAIIRELLDGNCTIEEVDTLRDPARALEERIIVTPTLVRVRPLPALRVVGDLSHHKIVVDTLGLGTKQ